MKVIHIESGLGNQMLSYCEFLAIKKVNPGEDCYLETIVYDIPECNDIICQWNGYELERVFNIKDKNISSIIKDDDWKSLISDIRCSEFWLKNWNYPVYFTKAFNNIGVNLENYRGDFEALGETKKTTYGTPKYRETYWFRYANYLRKKYYKKSLSQNINYEEKLFIKTNKDIFTGQKLFFKYINSGIEKIESEIRKTFIFPKIYDIRNKQALSAIRQTDSVAIHARRGDMLGYNFDCYVGGYFKRCVKYIKSRIENPVFFIFCDTESIEWARRHEKTFGLNFNNDKVYFIDWNKGVYSWRDMQLMAECKHQIITRSSFGWWGAWLNTNPNKITCSPDVIINTTHHF